MIEMLGTKRVRHVRAPASSTSRAAGSTSSAPTTRPPGIHWIRGLRHRRLQQQAFSPPKTSSANRPAPAGARIFGTGELTAPTTGSTGTSGAGSPQNGDVRRTDSPKRQPGHSPKEYVRRLHRLRSGVWLNVWSTASGSQQRCYLRHLRRRRPDGRQQAPRRSTWCASVLTPPTRRSSCSSGAAITRNWYVFKRVFLRLEEAGRQKTDLEYAEDLGTSSEGRRANPRHRPFGSVLRSVSSRESRRRRRKAPTRGHRQHPRHQRTALNGERLYIHRSAKETIKEPPSTPGTPKPRKRARQTDLPRVTTTRGRLARYVGKRSSVSPSPSPPSKPK